ncbi:MAG TPA: hypothetical protein VF765_29910 [Polyangiaceae bacterium]
MNAVSMSKLGMALTTAAFVLGCGAYSRWLPTNPPPHPMQPKPAEQVDVFTSDFPSRPFVEVGLIQSSPGLTASDLDVLAELRRAGGARGCDGVIVNGETKSATASGYGGVATAQEKTAFRAACIVYK